MRKATLLDLEPLEPFLEEQYLLFIKMAIDDGRAFITPDGNWHINDVPVKYSDWYGMVNGLDS